MRASAGRIGMIFQEPGTSLNPVMRIGQQLVEATRRTPSCGAAARAGDRVAAQGRHPRARAADRRVPVPHERWPEAARDDRAMTLAAEPDYLVADEPTTALDDHPGADPDLLKDPQKERGLACC